MIQRVSAVLVLALAFTLWAPPNADAQDAYSCIEELSDDEVRYRIRYIEDSLQDGKKHATRWRYTWMGLWLGAGAGMTYAAVKNARDNDQADKFGWAYLAAGSYFVAVTHMMLPAPGVWGAKRIRRQEDGSEEARRAKLLYATNTLKKANGVQGLSAGALPVVGGLVFGVVGGTIKATQWTGHTRGLTAALYLGPPIALALQTATAPTEGVKAWEAYRGIACSSKYYDTHEEGPEFDFSVNPGGTNFSVRF